MFGERNNSSLELFGTIFLDNDSGLVDQNLQVSMVSPLSPMRTLKRGLVGRSLQTTKRG